VVSALVDIARKLGMRIVAEGVEREEQAAVLRRFGCRLGQGFLYSRPVSVIQCTRLLDAYGQGRQADRDNISRRWA
jgi:EAL domain-containing protein (putative c-di-GMP-specific phosphodiesterase class I)